MESKIISVLKSIGFTNNEILVYLDLLKNSTSSALEISKRTKLHRSNIYDILRFLEDKELITKVMNNDKQLFKATGPESILHYIKEKENEIKDIISELSNLTKDNSEKGIASISYGLPGLRKSFENMMSQNESIMIFNVPTNIQEFLGNDFLNDFHKWRIKNKILLKVIFSKHCARSEIANSYPLTEVKCLENGNESLSAFVVCKDLVSLILSNKPLSIIDIKGKNIADTFKNNFEFFWVHSKKLG